MVKFAELTLHEGYRIAKQEHRQWREDIARWHDEHQRIATMLAAVRMAWDAAELCVEDHVRQVQSLAESSRQQGEVLDQEGWAAEVSEELESNSDEQRFELAQAEARKVHENLQRLYVAMAAEVHELLRLTLPDSVVLETN